MTKQPESIDKSTPIEDKNDTKEFPSVSDVTETNTNVKESSGITESLLVHYVMFNGEHRPAIIVNSLRGSASPDHLVNLSVFTDYANDANSMAAEPYNPEIREQILNGLFWATSVRFDNKEKPRHSWHWIESHQADRG